LAKNDEGSRIEANTGTFTNLSNHNTGLHRSKLVRVGWREGALGFFLKRQPLNHPDKHRRPSNIAPIAEPTA
jgi:hypothetical protein